MHEVKTPTIKTILLTIILNTPTNCSTNIYIEDSQTYIEEI